MNKCVKCGAEIPDDKELCDKCLDNEGDLLGFEESYLEDLLKTLSDESEQEDGEQITIEDSDNSEDLNLDSIIGDLLDNLDNSEEVLSADTDSLANNDGMDDLLSILDSVNDSEEIQDINDIFTLDDISNDSLEDIDSPERASDKSANMGDVLSDSLGAVSPYQDQQQEEELLNLIPQSEEKKEKVGLIKKLFGNIHNENDSENDSLENEEKKKNADKKEQASDGKTEKKSKKKNAKVKKEKKIKVKKVKEKNIGELQEVLTEDGGKINKMGASIVFSFFTILTFIVVIGSNSFSYSKSIAKAREYFDEKDYSKAYNEVSGLNVKIQDKEICDKIINVMYVYKQLNSYNNYYSLKKYPEALDSLLKGLKRYDSYIANAKELGVKSDLDDVKEQILTELNQVFGLTEDKAYEIIESETMDEYSEKVQDVITKNIE